MAMTLDSIMKGAVEQRASDIHLKVGCPPIYRIDGELVRLPGDLLTDNDMTVYLKQLAGDKEIARFEERLELDGSYMLGDTIRFRVNVCREDSSTRIVMRLIPLSLKKIADLGLPPVLKKVCGLKTGLVLVTGPTGSGKSTSLAAMIDEINENRPVHIITIEDPLEFVHRDKKAIVTQREVGQDTLSFANSLRGALRQDPDVILIGEMRDAETVKTALASAETGHLVFSTLHTVDAVETLNRIIDFFDAGQQVQIRKQLASVLRAVVSQRIMALKTGTGRCVVAEVLIGSRTVREHIEQGKSFRDIVKLIEDGYDQYGMQSFDQGLYDLYKAGTITAEVAMQYATSPKDLALRIQGMRTV